MSLDVYLKSQTTFIKKQEPQIFVRENGKNRGISIQEWNERYGIDAILVLNEKTDVETNILFRANITHNLTKMAGEAGLYDAIWRPYRLKEGYVEMDNYADEMNFEDSQTVFANELIDLLKEGLKRLEENPDEYKEFDPPNGWGSYETLVRFVEQYLTACIKYPNAIVEVSR